MDLYLPIAGLSVNMLVIVGLGGIVGLLSGMFGVGGGFLTTPLLIFYGIPPAVAVASSATQITGASVSGVIAHGKRDGVDYHMGWVLVAGGAIGSLAGGWLFRLLQQLGQIDTVVGLLYVVLLGSIGIMMARESIGLLVRQWRGAAPKPASRRHHPLIAILPLRWRFYKSGLYISPLAPALLGFATGMMTVLMGVGGGFILVPAMIYLLGMSTRVVVGTSLFQILFVTAATTMVHALTTHAVDMVLAALLLIGSVTGAQIGARFAQLIKPEYLRLALAFIVLVVAIRMGLGLGWRPAEIYSIEPLA
ncbi:sulfite exporter TauE/SafE family protein [Sphingomonas crocodyli]|uniref:Probable membrane transporter protein n=1 Tax=Sphingomonas crocodyli TaxID=1979270 RepID=A0A437LV92_9SPHN|nr:sulfite exporter TauE/SafE family protein [Sphingomonas crocodyli]RVT89361.1 sulfite exporter TauE/SafE family protein [Sphingomonas crocodyli]